MIGGERAIDAPGGRTMEDRDEKDARTWATFCHLASFVGYIGIPFGNILGPLVIWLMKRNEFELVDDQGRESINFQLSFMLYIFISLILVFVLVGILFLIVLPIAQIVLVIIASIRANNGEYYRYPLTIRFLH